MIFYGGRQKMKTFNFIVEQDFQQQRIDKYLSEMISDYSRAHLQKLIQEDKVMVNQKIVKSNYKIRVGDHIQLSMDDPIPLNVPAQDIQLNIVYEDLDFLIINKPQGMVVHPAPGHLDGTLVNAVLHHCKAELSGINGVSRPGIVHRIDKNTSGLLVICKNDQSHVHLAKQLKNHTITRKYEAIVYGAMEHESGSVEAPIGRHETQRKQMAINYKHGKSAITHYRVLNSLNNKYTHLELQLETGRTHQIRVHMASIHHPILGDDVYGPKKSQFKLLGQVLHAKTLGFIHPSTGEYMEFTSEIPEYFQKLINQLK